MVVEAGGDSTLSGFLFLLSRDRVFFFLTKHRQRMVTVLFCCKI